MRQTRTLARPPAAGRRRPRRAAAGDPRRGQWLRFALLALLTAIALVPVGAVVVVALQPGLGSTATGFTLQNFTDAFTQTQVLTWLRNSLMVTLVTTLVAVAVAAPAGYVVSRARNRLVSGYSLVLFVVQSLPVITAVIPLFILFARLGLVDNLTGVTIIYVGATISVAVWMMAAYYNSIPVALEEAAWIDGASVLAGFIRIVLRNSLPGVLSTSIFSFLLAWNDYLIAVVFLRSNSNYTLPVGLESFFQQNETNWGLVMAVAVVMTLPPVAVFAFLNKYFSIGGISGSLAAGRTLSTCRSADETSWAGRLALWPSNAA